MKPSLLQRQWQAIIVGLVWPFPYLWIVALTIGSIAGHGRGDSSWNSAAQIGLALGIPILIAYGVAMVSGPYDLLALVTMLIPAAAFCVFMTGISWLSSRGLTSHEAGLELGIYLKFTLIPLAAVAAFALVGIALKRLSCRRVPLDEELTRAYRDYLKWDFGILAAMISLALVACAVQAIHVDPLGVHGLFLSPREHFVVEEKQILDSPTATEREKIGALFSTQWDKPELGVIRDALKDQSMKVRFFAAVILLEQRDGSGLSELESSLMHSAKVPIFDDDTVKSGQTSDYSVSLNLEYITDKNAAPILTRLELSDDAEVRGAAHLALERIRLAK